MTSPPAVRWWHLVDTVVGKEGPRLVTWAFKLPIAVSALERLDRKTRTGYLLWGMLSAFAASRSIWKLSHPRWYYQLALEEWRSTRRNRRHLPRASKEYRLAAALVALLEALPHRREYWKPLLGRAGYESRFLVYGDVIVLLAFIGQRIGLLTWGGRGRPRLRYMIARWAIATVWYTTFAYIGVRNAFLSVEEYSRRHAESKQIEVDLAQRLKREPDLEQGA